MRANVAKAVKVKNTIKGLATQAHERRKAPEPFAPRPPNQAHEHGRSLSPGSTSLFELFTQQEEKNSKVSLFPRSSQRAPSGTRCFGQAESRDAERVRANCIRDVARGPAGCAPSGPRHCKLVSIAPAGNEPRVSRNQFLKEQAHNSVEILFLHKPPPSIDTVWLALQEVMGVENMPGHLRNAVWVAMLRNPNETPFHMATLILEAKL